MAAAFECHCFRALVLVFDQTKDNARNDSETNRPAIVTPSAGRLCMQTLSRKIEAIILQHGTRGMNRLYGALKPGYCGRAAQMILDNRGTVLIGTGFPVSGSFESDGPIGAIALYHVLRELGSTPVFVCAPPIARILARDFATHELSFSDWPGSRKVARRALAALQPSLIVSIERPGVAADGRYYNMHGKDISAFTAKFDLFVTESTCPSIAFGDGGNEIGMGNIPEALAQIDIIPSVTPCDELVIASVSNWGVYGVIAALSSLVKKDLFAGVDPRSIAEYLVANGCLDGVTVRAEVSEDGFPIAVGISIIAQLRLLAGGKRR